MASPHDCLTGAELHALADGVAGARTGTLEEHLQSCPRCAAAFEALLEPTAALVREHAAGVNPDQDLVDQLREQGVYVGPPTTSGTTATGSAQAGSPALMEELRQLLSPPQGADEIGWLGPFRVLGVLGHGGMGVVLSGEDTLLRQPVALKVMRPKLLHSPELRRQFLHEARAAAQLDHEHVVPIRHVGEERGVPFIVMPLLRGESLADRLRREPRPGLALVFQVGIEAALGLGAAHAVGLIHRDIKPANIWLRALDGGVQVRLLDFGLVRLDHTAGWAQTPAEKIEEIVGTPAYMAPEQARGEVVDARADLFGLGCVLYEMLTGRQAFEGQGLMAILAAVQNHQPHPPVEADPAIPQGLSELVIWLLAKDARNRPTVTEIIDTLRSVQRAAEQPPEVKESTAQPVPRCEEKPPRSRKKLLLVAGVVLAASVLTSIVVFTFLLNRAGTTPPGKVSNGNTGSKESGKNLPVRVEKVQDFSGNNARVVCVTFSPDSKFVLTGSEAGDVHLWEVERRMPIREYVGHKERVLWARFSRDGQRIVTADTEGTVRGWETATGHELQHATGIPITFGSAFDQEGKRMAVWNKAERSIDLWQANGQRLSPTLEGPPMPGPADYRYLNLVWTPDGRRIIACGAGVVRIWEVGNRRWGPRRYRSGTQTVLTYPRTDRFWR